MATINPVTGDSLISKATTEQYKSGYDLIDWSKKQNNGADNPGKEPDNHGSKNTKESPRGR
jgi:hypothetical protein